MDRELGDEVVKVLIVDPSTAFLPELEYEGVEVV